MIRQTGKLLTLSLFLVWLSLVPAAAQSSDIVLHASKASVKVGAWTVKSDSTAAGGVSLANPDAGAKKRNTPLADPTSYFEMTFYAEAGKAYHVWLRGKAEGDFWGNDSVHLQFSESVDEDGTPLYRIGTKSSMAVNLEDGRHKGLRAWGWQDNGWQSIGSEVYFDRSGTQTIRVQTREDGLHIDQIVLSTNTYLNSAPGSLKDDDTILSENIGHASVNQKPRVTIQASQLSGTAPLPVSFSVNASDPDGSIVKYSWSFGDGAGETDQEPSHRYEEAGNYTAKLTVTDNDGATATASLVIKVSNASGGTPLKVLTWNVHKGVGTDNERNIDRFANWIAKLQPDLVALCEIMRYSISDDDDLSTSAALSDLEFDQADDDDSEEDQPQYIADLLKRKTGRTWYLHWMPKFPGSREGNAILSRYPFLSKSGKYLSHQRSVARVEVQVGDRRVQFFGTHLSVESASWRNSQAHELTKWMDDFDGPRIIGGDFNAAPTTSEMGVVKSVYYDAWAEAVDNNTDVAYPDNTPGRTRRGRIDFLFYAKNTGSLILKGARVPDTRDLGDKGVKILLGTADDKGVRPSDHNAVMATFEVR